MGLSHNLTFCLASLLSVSSLYSLLFFFSFFYLGFFALSVTPFGVECFFFFFLIDYLGHWLLSWGGSWVLDWPDDGLEGQGGFMIFWEGARAKN